ncbi:MAG: APC family permease [Aggregatilineales bacterium]
MQVVNLRRMIIGEPLATHQLIHQRLSKIKALAVFSSDALSSSAYATEAILLVLIGAGTGALGVSWSIALGISALLLIVAFSYFQTIHAYPNGGGAYIVAKDNLGILPGLTAASSLLIDYILTVAVSVSAGVAALTSAFEGLAPYRIEIALAIVVFITIMNLRGVQESGTFFSIPTYAFVFGILAMILYGVFRVISGDIPVPTGNQVEAATESATALSGLTLFIALRAYAAGCTALTGIEAISNGIPAFKVPESKNAGQTLIVMVFLLCTMFIGITFLANNFPVVIEEGMETTVLSQVSREIFGEGSVLFYYIQFSTLLILSLAANTAFADFPRLASLIAADRYLPRQLTNWGDRLVYSNGIIALSVIAGILIVMFRAREHNLLPLYAVGVFISFTLSQSGMVIHWLKERDKEGFKPDFMWRFRLSLNAFGALCTAVVGLILMVTKFAEGAWIVMLAIPLLMTLFIQIHKHYLSVAHSLTLDGIKPGPIRVRTKATGSVPVVVLMNSLNRCSLQALEYAMSVSDNVHACAIAVEPEAVEVLEQRWHEWNLHSVTLDVVESPYREIARPLIEYLHEFDEESHMHIPTMVVIPEFVVEHWWERLLHNGTSVTIREALYRDQIARGRGRPVINVPYRIGDELYSPETITGKTGKLSPQKVTESKPVSTPEDASL